MNEFLRICHHWKSACLSRTSVYWLAYTVRIVSNTFLVFPLLVSYAVVLDTFYLSLVSVKYSCLKYFCLGHLSQLFFLRDSCLKHFCLEHLSQHFLSHRFVSDCHLPTLSTYWHEILVYMSTYNNYKITAWRVHISTWNLAITVWAHSCHHSHTLTIHIAYESSLKKKLCILLTCFLKKETEIYLKVN